MKGSLSRWNDIEVDIRVHLAKIWGGHIIGGGNVAKKYPQASFWEGLDISLSYGNKQWEKGRMKIGMGGDVSGGRSQQGFMGEVQTCGRRALADGKDGFSKFVESRNCTQYYDRITHRTRKVMKMRVRQKWPC